jgi:para-aminobenzoate synthetase/4-amino-4-deoxychorismate lyase
MMTAPCGARDGLQGRLGGAPFVLCEDARPDGGAGRLFSAPIETIAARSLSEVASALERVRGGLRRGLHAAGWLAYEAGFTFEPRLMSRWRARTRTHALPLLWFGLYESVAHLDRDDLAAILPDPNGAWLSPPRARMTRSQYGCAFKRARRFIEAGDAYQINLGYRADLTLFGHPLAAYSQLRTAGQGGWSAVAHDGETWLLSTSPELFFRLSGGAIEAKPMKGTAKRRVDPAEDLLAAQALRNDAKELAENVMIVDLLRNDISRVASRGSVHVPELFAVETYPTLHTLTSTVRATVKEGCDAIDVLGALFPCGSITGAPKIRAMEIIDELEADPRGAYAGAIGWMAPDGSAEFNVAIRTITVSRGRAEVGLGSAVVFDSTEEGEWDECRTKGAFITANAPVFELLETMWCDAGCGIRHLDLHLARLEDSARTFGFGYDERLVRTALAAAAEKAVTPSVMRLSLAANGEVSIELRPPPVLTGHAVKVGVAPLPVASDDFRLRHKTTLRGFHDGARRESGADEVVFVDEAGFVTEGSFTNVFVERQGVLLTPPASRGLLPGVLRASLLAAGRAREAELRLDHLANGFYVGNAVRGLLAAKVIGSQDRE